MLKKIIGIGMRHTFLPNPEARLVPTVFLQLINVFRVQHIRRGDFILAQSDETVLRLHPIISPRMLHFNREEKLIEFYPTPQMRNMYALDPGRRTFYQGREWSYAEMRRALEQAKETEEFLFVTDRTGDPVLAVLPAHPKL